MRVAGCSCQWALAHDSNFERYSGYQGRIYAYFQAHVMLRTRLAKGNQKGTPVYVYNLNNAMPVHLCRRNSTSFVVRKSQHYLNSMPVPLDYSTRSDLLVYTHCGTVVYTQRSLMLAVMRHLRIAPTSELSTHKLGYTDNPKTSPIYSEPYSPK